jgi:hypothetical protein
MIGTPITMGFYPGSQCPIDERYLNNGVPYLSTAQALSLIPMISRSPYLPVNVLGVEYWFSEDMTTLNAKWAALSLLDGSVTLGKMVDMATASLIYRKTAGDGPPEVQTLATLRTDLNIPADPTNALNNKVDKAAGQRLITAGEAAILGNTSNTNSGDETQISILAKLGLTGITGDNTGDQDLSGFVEKIMGSRLITAAEIAKLASMTDNQAPAYVLEFAGTNTPSVENYDTLFALNYGQNPNIRLVVYDGENELPSMQVPTLFKTLGRITRIAYDLSDSISGKILISK